MSTWQTWHEEYDDPGSSLSRRLGVVREQLATILRELPATAPVQLVSLCAGDGRDVFPVLDEVRPDVDAVLVELDPGLADAARHSAAGFPGVEVRTADAGLLASYDGVPPAQVLLGCGVFGNVSDADVERTVRSLPLLLADDARVIWTRGASVPHDPSTVEGDPAEWVRGLFADVGFVEEDFVRPDDVEFRVGVHRWPGGARPERPARLFEFIPEKR